MALSLSRRIFYGSRFFHRCYHSNKLQRRVSTPSFLPSHRLKPKHSSSSQLRNLSTQPWQDEDLPPDPIPLHLHHHGNGVHSSRTHRIHGLVSKPCPKVGRLVLVRHGQSVWNVTDPTRDLTARFTGWADIELTEQGKDQAVAAGRAIQYAVEMGLLPSIESNSNIPAIDIAFCSLLKRATDTMNIILKDNHLAELIPSSEEQSTKCNAKISTDIKDVKSFMNKHVPKPKYQYKIPIINSWRLNERHYGALVGLSKEGAERLYGKVRLTRWRDSWDVPPPPMPLEMVQRWGREDHCQPVTIVRKGDFNKSSISGSVTTGKIMGINSDGSGSSIQEQSLKAGKQSELRIVEHSRKKRKSTVQQINSIKDGSLQIDDQSTTMPASESLHDTYERFIPLWIQGIAPHLRAGRTVLLVGHANTIRSILFAIDPDVVRIDNMKKIKIPSALPLVYEFVDQDGGGCLEMIHVDDSETSIVENNTHETARYDEGIASHIGDVQLIQRQYQLEGRDCSQLLPGNVRVWKPHRPVMHAGDYDAINSAEVEVPNKKGSSKDFRYKLNGVWVETDETESASFCTDVGLSAGEGDIA